MKNELERFVTGKNIYYHTLLKEIRSGRKRFCRMFFHGIPDERTVQILKSQTGRREI